MGYKCVLGKCEDKLKDFEDNYFDSVVCDPPYGISFMGKKWDYDVPSVEQWKEIFRVLKPGGHLLSFSGTRTYHRMAVNIEDAGFEVRDMVSWVYGSGFPKSLNISKAIDKAAGAEREVLCKNPNARNGGGEIRVIEKNYENDNITAPATEEAKQWEGWGTSLKPALEPICLARKPLSEKTVAENVLKWGTGGINVDGCRVDTKDKLVHGGSLQPMPGDTRTGKALGKFQYGTPNTYTQNKKGRFPANLIHDGSDEVLELFPDTKSGKMKQKIQGGEFNVYGKQYPRDVETIGDSGSAARFFYCAKASKSERNLGLDKFTPKQKVFNGQSATSSTDPKDLEQRWTTQPSPNNHATVKPIALMRYLCRLVTPKNGTVLDPFMGSGSTGIGAVIEGFNFLGIEMDDYFYEISKARIAYWKTNPPKDSEIVKRKEVKQKEWW